MKFMIRTMGIFNLIFSTNEIMRNMDNSLISHHSAEDELYTNFSEKESTIHRNEIIEPDDYEMFYNYLLKNDFCKKNITGTSINMQKSINFDNSIDNKIEEKKFEYCLQHFILYRLELSMLKQNFLICGFSNFDGTCYANTALQILFSFPGFFIFIRNAVKYENNNFLESLLALCEEYICKQNFCINTYLFQKAFNQHIKKMFVKGESQGPFTFFLLLITYIKNVEYNDSKSLKYCNETFLVSFKEFQCCLNCKKYRVKSYTNFYLNINLFLLTGGLNNYIQSKSYINFCDECKTSKMFKKKLFLIFPNVLIIRISDRKQTKEYNASQLSLEESIVVGEFVYKLFAYIIPFYNETNEGHVACVVKKHHKWFLFDDNLIMIVNDHLNPPIYPYVLLYAKNNS